MSEIEIEFLNDFLLCGRSIYLGESDSELVPKSFVGKEPVLLSNEFCSLESDIFV